MPPSSFLKGTTGTGATATRAMISVTSCAYHLKVKLRCALSVEVRSVRSPPVSALSFQHSGLRAGSISTLFRPYEYRSTLRFTHSTYAEPRTPPTSTQFHTSTRTRPHTPAHARTRPLSEQTLCSRYLCALPILQFHPSRSLPPPPLPAAPSTSATACGGTYLRCHPDLPQMPPSRSSK